MHLKDQIANLIRIADVVGYVEAAEHLRTQQGLPSDTKPLAHPRGIVIAAGLCGTWQKNGFRVCLKTSGHADRHHYVTPPPPPTRRQATTAEVDSFPVKGGSKTFTVHRDGPCKVVGLGKFVSGKSGPRTTASGYRVVRAVRREDGIVEVDVQKGRGEPIRTVTSDRIVYVRPKAG